MRKLFVWCAAVAIPTLTLAQNFGRWVGASDAHQVAVGVHSDSGALFGMNCSRSTSICEWSLSTETPCKPGQLSPMLMTSRIGAMHIWSTCIGQSNDAKLWRYGVRRDLDSRAPETAISETVKAGGTIGIVGAKDGGSFVVYRFDVDNHEAAFQALVESLKTPPPTGRDGVL